MKVIEFFSDNQTELLTETVKPFSSIGLTNLTDPQRLALQIDYIFIRSKNKTVSKTFQDIFNSVGRTKCLDILTNQLNSKYLKKWQRLQDLLDLNYDAIADIDYTDTRSGTNTDTETRDLTASKTGTNTTSNDYSTSENDESKRSVKETTTKTTKQSNDVYGFNSETPVGDNTTDIDDTESFVANKDDNVTSNTKTTSGTDTKTYTLGEQTDDTGTISKDNEFSETYNRKGRKTDVPELLDKEITFRDEHLFFDIVLKDIDEILTLKIY